MSAVLHPRVRALIEQKLRWPALRPIQADALEPVAAGNHALLIARTAGGKTEAAAFPLLSRQLSHPTDGVGVLWVAPLRALINQLGERLIEYGHTVGVRVALRHSDIEADERRAWEDDPSDWLLTTPESMEAMLLRGDDWVRERFAGLRTVVVDELHAFLDGPRGVHLLALIERFSLVVGADLQRVGLSATVGNPAEVLAWLAGSSDARRVVIEQTAAPAERRLMVEQVESDGLAPAVAALVSGRRALVFCRSRRAVEDLCAALAELGVSAEPHHGDVGRERRAATEARLREAPHFAVVCTSTLELGIDLGDLELVVQVDAPDSVASFMQRLGRSGRRSGQVATTSVLTTKHSQTRQAIAIISLAIERWVEPLAPFDVDDVFAHQLVALVMSRECLTEPALAAFVSRTPLFAELGTTAVATRIAALEREGLLTRAGPGWIAGPVALDRFGGRNRAKLCAVFGDGSTPQAIVSGDEQVGQFDGRLTPGTHVRLGGQTWEVLDVDRGVAQVRPSQGAARFAAPAPRYGSGARIHPTVRERMARLGEIFAERPVWVGEIAWRAVIGVR